MNISILCLGLCLFSAKVLASARAGPFESVFFYYAYRIDTIAAPGSGVIANRCPGTGPGGVCYFDEFVRWIQKSSDPWTGHTSVGNNLDPDPYDAADQLRTAGIADSSSRCSNLYDPHKLYPSRFPVGTKPPYTVVMEDMVHTIQNCRGIAGDAKFSSQLNNVRRAFGLIYEARIGDMTHHLIEGVNRLLAKNGVTWTCNTFTKELSHGYTIEMVDTLGTIDAHPDMGDALENAIWDFVETYDYKRSNPRTHYRSVLALQEYQNMLEGSCA